MTAATVEKAGTVAAQTGEKSVGEKSPDGEKGVGEKSLAKNRNSLKSDGMEFSPMEFSPMTERHFSPTHKADFSPMKKPVKNPRLKLVNPAKTGRRGRPRNPDLPPAPGKYFYWSSAGSGLKLEKRKPTYEYVGFIMPVEWAHLRGRYDESYILQNIIAAIRVKRARSAQSRRTRASNTR